MYLSQVYSMLYLESKSKISYTAGQHKIMSLQECMLYGDIGGKIPLGYFFLDFRNLPNNKKNCNFNEMFCCHTFLMIY